MQPGSIVRFRDRDWVLLPSDDPKTAKLRPLTGAIDEVVAVHRELEKLVQYTLAEERIQPSQFPAPSPDDLSDAGSAFLLWQAARLTLREGATPLRCLGRISIRPRVYQFVPLLMALRLDPVRLFIADDVGVGKTIEALLVARELLDRGEIRRLAVLCPPYLCDQWEKELREKFNLESVIVRSSTISRLERWKPADKSIYEYYPIQVISIDWVKSDRNKHQFLQFCPDLVIVDEAHGAAEASPHNKSQQQRHQLLREIAQDPSRHLILLTATPHSGVEAAFCSLLGLLQPNFRQLNVGSLAESDRAELARHFVQRTRKDIEQDWQAAHCFPERISTDETYTLSKTYRELFEKTFAFCSEIVRTGQNLEERKRRVRYWGALALLRCVMSSPAAAVAALKKRLESAAPHPDEESVDFTPLVFENAHDHSDDENPTPPIEQAEAILPASAQRRLRRLEQLAQSLCDSNTDTKIARCIEVVRDLLREKFYPIIWCRYVATAEYVATQLQNALADDVQVTTITGRIGDEERRAIIDQIDATRPRVLVATDCLSEGINLQEKFTAVLHYDLPWNPNRLEQREGRVDRYGQTSPQVKAVRFYGRDNPVDGAVIEVLLDKAKEIHRVLGTYVPVPDESETVMEAVLNSLFLRQHDQSQPLQLQLFHENPELQEFHKRWDLDAQRERTNRTRFAQRAIKPEEVQRELEATDAVLGDPDAVCEFVLSAGQRLGLAIQPELHRPDVYCVDLSSVTTLPDAIRLALPEPRASATKRSSPAWHISFVSPTPQGAEYVGRNHPFVATLARYLLEEALTKGKDAAASRCGVLRTRAVRFLTSLLLLRVRYLLEIPEQPPMLSEQVLVLGCHPSNTPTDRWLPDNEAMRLLAEAKPDGNLSTAEKRELVEMVFKELGVRQGKLESNKENGFMSEVNTKIFQKAQELENSHKRIRKAVRLRVRELKVNPQLPPDLLGILILQPMVKP
ncbi:MAG: helicase [Pirellulaceae bacterium]|nr:MAG: helicase [Pirellulaceae bacterium]